MNQSQVEIYNSLTRSVEPVEPTSPVGIYVCGITPYDATHLGHAFTYTTFDVLIRLLRHLGHEVTYVQNITDVDDDILKRAKTVGVDWRTLGDSEVEKFLRDCDALNNLRPTVMPKATGHIDDMLAMIQALLERGVAYERNGNVYFEVGKAPTFGTRLFEDGYESQLSTANERGNFPDDPEKKQPLDFVLWQRSKPGEPFWSSPWGQGRPGWHIECSALGRHYLGDHFAIHGGGYDLLFPHHESEIAQGEYSTGVIPASHWVHTEMLRYEGEKMSKSLGNMVFVSDLLKTTPADAIRYVLLDHHYRTAWEYEAGELERAVEIARELSSCLGTEGEASPQELAESGAGVLNALMHDLDTPAALAELRSLATSDGPTARRAARTLATEILGFRLGAR